MSNVLPEEGREARIENLPMHYFTCNDKYMLSLHNVAIHLSIIRIIGLCLLSWISLLRQLRLLAVEKHDEKDTRSFPFSWSHWDYLNTQEA